MELIQQEDLINKISQQYQPYIKALRTPDLRSQSRSSNLAAILNSLVLCTAMGKKISDDREADKFITEKLYDELMIKYPFVRHGEIDFAFRKGALGEYDHLFPKDKYIGVNVQTCFKWIRFYLESEDLKKAKRAWIDLTEMPKTAKTITSVDLTESIKQAYKEYLETGNLPFTASHYYIVLCRLHNVKSLIKDNSVRVSIRESAMKEYRASLVEKKLNLKDNPQFEQLIKWCLEGKNPTYDSFSRRLALKYYFDECKGNGKQPI